MFGGRSKQIVKIDKNALKKKKKWHMRERFSILIAPCIISRI